MDASFTQKAGTTPSGGTGPSGAADGTYYMYAETSSAGNPNKNFDLAKSFSSPSKVLAGVTFQYHMYGATMGSVILESGVPAGEAGGTTWTTIWSKSGNLGDQWNQAVAFAPQSPTMLRFTYVAHDHHH